MAPPGPRLPVAPSAEDKYHHGPRLPVGPETAPHPPMDITFEVVGVPVPQGRVRAKVVTQYGKKPYATFYDPPESAEWKRTVAVQALPHRPLKARTGAVGVFLSFRLPRPRSLPKRVTQHMRTPDLDNLVKAMLDALRIGKRFYLDDSQIAFVRATKVYDATPGVTVRLFDL